MDRRVRNSSPAVIAHRGASARAPENTRSAFALALRAGARAIEFDVQLSSDGEPVVFHDSGLSRTTDGKGTVAGRPFSWLRALDAGSWYSPRFEGEQIPTLAEALGWITRARAVAHVEIKGKQERLVRAVAREIEAHDAARRCVVSSFYPEALFALRRIAPRLKSAWIMKRMHRGWRGYARRFGVSAIHPRHDRIGARNVREAHDDGLAVRVWTIDSAAALRRAVRLGVDGVIVNDPAWAKSVLRRG